jgi:hypothetical protein
MQENTGALSLTWIGDGLKQKSERPGRNINKNNKFIYLSVLMKSGPPFAIIYGN